MSRRDSRVQISVRHSDNLLEFESFKKKFLFANKQITKQNCSLSLKIEELNAHISTLYIENLRLRASEIALQAQLRREKEKCQRIMADAEAATMDLLKRFGIIRQSYDVPTQMLQQTSRSPDSSPPQLCQKPPLRSPSALRLAQLPTVPDIAEDPEPPSSEDAPDYKYKSHLAPSLSRKSRNSMSHLPVASSARSGSPESPDNAADQADLQFPARKRKLVRRPSGLMPAPELGRPPSPVFGSPSQRAFDLSEEEEATAMQDVEAISARASSRQKEDHEREREQDPIKKTKKRSSKVKEDLVSEHDTRQENHVDKERGRDREKEKDRKERKKTSSSKDRERDRETMRLKDVTNSPRRRRITTSSMMDMDVDNELGEIERASPIEAIEATSRKAKALLAKLTAEDDNINALDGATLVPTSAMAMGLAAKARTMALEIEARKDDDEKERGQDRQAYLPTPAPSSVTSTPAGMRDSLVLPPVMSAGAGMLEQDAAGRERRARKSVNYAEPKLNTKMRRPDPISQQPPPGQRPSLSLMPVDLPPPITEAARSSPESDNVPAPASPVTKKKQARSSSSSSTMGAPAAKRKRLPLPDAADQEQMFDLDMDMESDGCGGDGHGSDADDADGEFSDFRGKGGGKWANVVTRRKSEHGGSSSSTAMNGTRQSRASAAAGSGSRRASVRDVDETAGPAGLRRHSMAV